ncbi:hypothetical protein EYS14_14405 [Alteromonadaceae bacterium M269]|nr:hypothetical protein EYS14_14405 [Alteromonadaceae bacterium M269]
MRRFTLLIFMTLWASHAIAFAPLSADTTNRVRVEVQRQFESLVLSAKTLDTKAYFKHIDSDKFSGLNADGTNWTSINDLKAIVEPGFAFVEKIESLEFPHVHITVIDEHTAILVNEYEQQILLKDGTRVEDAGGGTQVWSKASGEWKLVSISAASKAN